MDELLLPRGEEEATGGSTGGSTTSTGHRGSAMGEQVREQVRTFLWAKASSDIRRNIRDFCRKNGLLTLSVIAVITGCTLGFMLRGTHLSTQVRR